MSEQAPTKDLVSLDDLKRAIAAVEQAWKDDSVSDYGAAALRAEAWRTAFWWHASLAQRARQDMRQSLQELSDGMQLIERLP